MNFHFDIRGYLQPEGIVEMNLEEFEDTFVNQFDESETRYALMSSYKLYNQDLMNLIGTDFVQWVNGSFVSNKDHPRDIDLVTFIGWQTYSQYEKEIDRRFSKWNVGEFYPNLDAYTIWEYPTDHKFHQTFLADQAYWYEWFSTSRYNRAKNRFSKGFISIKKI